MLPLLRPGDRLRVDRGAYRGASPRPGEIVVIRDPDRAERWLIKRVKGVGPGRWWRTSRGLVPDRAGPEGGPVERPPDGVESVDLAPDAVWVEGDAPTTSRDSRRFGPILPEGVVGRAYRCYAPPDRRRDL
jgi:signal peptidase I